MKIQRHLLVRFTLAAVIGYVGGASLGVLYYTFVRDAAEASACVEPEPLLLAPTEETERRIREILAQPPRQPWCVGTDHRPCSEIQREIREGWSQ